MATNEKTLMVPLLPIGDGIFNDHVYQKCAHFNEKNPMHDYYLESETKESSGLKSPSHLTILS